MFINERPGMADPMTVRKEMYKYLSYTGIANRDDPAGSVLYNYYVAPRSKLR